ncbi:transcriptional regulator, GntR family [Pasteurella testudinis DSM 23072]|uniref:Transcriptional regulator, GntR family n=2 Tax=Pasteurella testudinis TaxID=761 RepID=A0A1W1V2W7_9PAST|nr:transcriptional regulator, GntR family [Pasteurella testudinis DSM 23072]SUB50488.1 transcriptional regulator NanR [Pasteurella testudinis]
MFFIQINRWGVYKMGRGRNQNLRYDTVNQILEFISSGQFQQYLPSQVMLAELCNVSRTTIRHALQYLLDIQIITEQNKQFLILRQPEKEDILSNVRIKYPRKNQYQSIDSYFKSVIQRKLLKPGDIFTELQLSKAAGVNIFTVREYLIQYSRFNLIASLSRGRWQLIEINEFYADKLFELRELLEVHALECFMALPKEDKRWNEMKMLFNLHQELRDNVVREYPDFSALDNKLHSLLLSAANNPFIDDFIELISVIFHFHYQWDNSNLLERNILAVEEHLAIIQNILNNDKPVATKELKQHLDTAKKTLKNSVALIRKSEVL